MNTNNTPHTVGHVGWSPDYKSTPKLPAIGELIARRSAAACYRWEDGPTPETSALMLENGRAIAQCKTRPPIWEKMKMLERERNLARAQTAETLVKLRWMLKAAQRQQEVNGNESPAMRYARIKCQQWADCFPDNAEVSHGDRERQPDTHPTHKSP